MFHEINFSPFATNVLDVLGDESLITPDGQAVRVRRVGMGFDVYIAGKIQYCADDNLSVSYFLNQHQVGRKA